ncbi:hypothetical protein WJX77_010651 [Trebouxia sp. C0004]
MACEDTEVTSARMAAAKALDLSIDPSRARCVELECLLLAKTAHISHLEAERDAQARSHAVRLAELQESCHKKVRQLQQLHREQLSAAQATAAAALTAAAAPAASAAVAEEIKAMSAMFEAEQAKRAGECSSLQDKLLSAEQRQEDLRIALETSSSQMASMQQQEQQPDSAAVLQLLEQQLVSLSHMVREKEQQIGALQETVQQQCDERTLMHIKYMQLQSAHQMETFSTASGNSPVQPIVTSSHAAQTPGANDGSMSHSTLLSSQMSAGKRVPEKAEAPAPSRGKLNRLASASEQQHGKSGLLGRIMATSSKTGKTV